MDKTSLKHIRIISEELVEQFGGRDNIKNMYADGIRDLVECVKAAGINIRWDVADSTHVDPEAADLYLRLIVDIEDVRKK
jgi:hypothetical protein